ncbi:MAG: hypothetical protein AMXMBFR25_16450 [Lysobacterales bacterium]
MSTGLRMVWCTCPPEVADTLARTLVDERLAACVNRISPVVSTYRWQGAVEQAQEALLAIKTSEARYPDLERRLRELHPYECPEIVATPLVAGLASYLDWMHESLVATALQVPRAPQTGPA